MTNIRANVLNKGIRFLYMFYLHSHSSINLEWNDLKDSQWHKTCMTGLCFGISLVFNFG